MNRTYLINLVYLCGTNRIHLRYAYAAAVMHNSFHCACSPCQQEEILYSSNILNCKPNKCKECVAVNCQLLNEMTAIVYKSVNGKEQRWKKKMNTLKRDWILKQHIKN